MPTYAALIYTDAAQENGEASSEGDRVMMSEYQQFGEKAGAAGVLLGGEALQPTATATTLHVDGGLGGDLVTADGPFAETKEVLGGFYLLSCADLDEAISWSAQIPGAWRGRVEVRPCIQFADED
ncbi:MAG: YciI family protein [Iamia sp.]